MAKETEPSGTKRKAACDADGEEGVSEADVEAAAAAPVGSVPEPLLSEVVDSKSEEPSTSSEPNLCDNDYLPEVVDDIFWNDCAMPQTSDFVSEDEVKVPYVGEKEPLSALAAEFQSGSPIIQEKIKLLGVQYDALRRTRGDGNCFYRSFMFSYLEQLLEKQDKHEVDRVLVNIAQCKKTLQTLGYPEFTYDDFFAIFTEQLGSVIQGSQPSISHEELLQRSRDQSISDYVVMFFRFITAGEIRRRAEFFDPFVAGLTNSTIDQFCKASVEPMGEESDHVHIIALSDALGVPIRVVYLDRSSCDAGAPTVNHHDFIPSSSNNLINGSSGSVISNPPKPFVMLLYRPGHYDILYPK